MFDWEYSLHLLSLIISGMVATFGVSFAWRYRKISGAMPLMWMALASTTWSFGNVLELASGDLAIKTFWAGVEYVGIATIPVLFLIFVLHYIGQTRWLTLVNLVFAFVVPVLTVILFWTNGYHELMWINPHLEGSPPIMDVAKTYGRWFWIQWAFSYVCLLASTVLLIRAILKLPGHRLQRIITMIGVLLPWAANISYVVRIFPVTYRDLTPVAFALTGMASMWGLIRPKYLELEPLARRMVIEKMTDSMFVIDQLYNIVDINPAGELFLHLTASDVFGMSIQQAFANHEGLAEHILARPIAETEIKLRIDNEDTFYDLRIVALHDHQGNVSGRIVILRDINSRKKAESELNRRLSQSLALNQSIAAISAATNSPTMHQIACRQIGESLKMTHTAFAFWDSTKQSLRVTAEYYGETHNLLQADYLIPITDNSAMAYSLRNHVALVIPNAQLNSLYDQTAVRQRQQHMPSMLMAPVSVDHQVIGAFCLDILPLHEITSDEVAFVQTIVMVVGAISGNQKPVGE